MIRALVVEDDPRILESVVDMIESLGHAAVTASCQEDARSVLQDDFAYALVDLEIPVKEGRGFARVENGINLLRELVGHFGKRVPVLVMTGHGNDNPFQAVECMRLGAADYVPKPFPTVGQTLDRAILRTLERAGRLDIRPRPVTTEPQEFQGGALFLHERHVEICGVDIPVSARMHAVLSLLTVKRATGGQPAYAGAELAAKLKVEGGQNVIARQIMHFRKRVMERLLEEANIQCGHADVIQSGGPGYRLREWMRVADESVHLSATPELRLLH